MKLNLVLFTTGLSVCAGDTSPSAANVSYANNCYGPGARGCDSYDVMLGLIKCCPTWGGLPQRCVAGVLDAEPEVHICQQFSPPPPTPPPQCFGLGLGCSPMQLQCCDGLECVSYQGSDGCWPAPKPPAPMPPAPPPPMPPAPPPPMPPPPPNWCKQDGEDCIVGSGDCCAPFECTMGAGSDPFGSNCAPATALFRLPATAPPRNATDILV